MLIDDVRNYFSGYLIIKIEGLSLERLINTAVSQKIRFWEINRPRYQELTAHINLQSYRKLHTIATEHNCRINILSKRGLPFKFHPFKRRIMMPVGFLFFLLFLYGLSSFIWMVEIEGVINADRQAILDALSENGIRPGAFKMNLDIRNIENKILNEIPDLIWIGIELRGSKALISIQEATKPPIMIDPLTPFNIVAKRDGIIEKIIVLDGEAMVSEGDTVKEGQLLVSGIIQDNVTGTLRYTHAQAQVLARTWYDAKSAVAYDRVKYSMTGKKVVHKYLEYGRFTIGLRKDNMDFEFYEISKNSVAFWGENRFFPVNIVTKKYYELIKVPVLLDDLKRQASEQAWEYLLEKIPNNAKIIDKRVKYDMIEDKEIIATVYVEVLEDIAQLRRIEINRGEVFIVGQPIEGEDLYHRQDG
jgi:similar to stage IV sporulation protein